MLCGTCPSPPVGMKKKKKNPLHVIFFVYFTLSMSSQTTTTTAISSSDKISRGSKKFAALQTKIRQWKSSTKIIFVYLFFFKVCSFWSAPLFLCLFFFLLTLFPSLECIVSLECVPFDGLLNIYNVFNKHTTIYQIKKNMLEVSNTHTHKHICVFVYIYIHIYIHVFLYKLATKE